jgi:hypothetical protein
MKKVALTLMLMQGEEISNWVQSVGNNLDRLNPAIHNIPILWDTFLDEFN